MATGGEALARDQDGRVVLVQGALPGESVRAEVTEVHRSYARAVAVEVLEGSPARVPPACPHVARGCGGCGWQHVEPAAQAELKADIVRDNLWRLGHIRGTEVAPGGSVGPFAYRTSLRVAIRAGRPGFRRARAHDVVTVGDCLVAHPALSDLLAGATYGRARGATLRCGGRTGERLAVLDPSARGAVLPGDVTCVGLDELGKGRQAWYHEEVAGARLRVSAGSFFQSSTEGAELLVSAVGEALEGTAGHLVDAYGGVGLFGATLGRHRRLTVLESSEPSAADARANLPEASVVAVDVARWEPSPAEVVIADPPRRGLGPRAAAVLAGTGASCLVLVSCDPASLGRDAALLSGHGFRLEQTMVLDLFPGTPHIESVSRFAR